MSILVYLCRILEFKSLLGSGFLVVDFSGLHGLVKVSICSLSLRVPDTVMGNTSPNLSA